MYNILNQNNYLTEAGALITPSKIWNGMDAQNKLCVQIIYSYSEPNIKSILEIIFGKANLNSFCKEETKFEDVNFNYTILNKFEHLGLTQSSIESELINIKKELESLSEIKTNLNKIIELNTAKDHKNIITQFS